MRSLSLCLQSYSWQVGCNCKLDQQYTAGQGSKWLHANAIVHTGGTRQMILIVDGKY